VFHRSLWPDAIPRSGHAGFYMGPGVDLGVVIAKWFCGDGKELTVFGSSFNLTEL
jgi:hypothetical protein